MVAGRSQTPSLRTDARRNREAILRVADEAFQDGPELVPLDEIARRAGLGRATIYRHFPDRQALAAEITRRQMEALGQAVAEGLGGAFGFRDLLHAVLINQISMPALVAVLRELPVQDQVRHARTLVTTLTPMFLKDRAEGRLRPDAEPQDLLLIHEMIETAVTTNFPHAGHEAAVQRLIVVLLDGLFLPAGPDSGPGDQERVLPEVSTAGRRAQR